MNEPRQENDSELLEEIRIALLRDAPREEERAAMARAALERAEQPEPRRRLVRVAPWLIGAAAAAAVAFVVPSPEPAGQPIEAGQRTIEEEREANREFLRSEKVRGHLAQNQGHWAAIAGGHTLVIHGDLSEVLSKVEKAQPDVKHRFVWKIGEEGDVAYNFTWGDQPWAGTKFLAETRLALGRGKKPGWTFYSEKDPKKRAQFTGKDNRPWLPVLLGAAGRDEGTTITFIVSSGSYCPLLLPEGHRFPLSEIPGTAVVDGDMGRSQWQLRRHLVRARIPQLGLDTVVEALELTKPVKRGAERLVLGGLAWLAYEGGVLEKARREGKPVLVLIGPKPEPQLEAPFRKARDLLERFVLTYPASAGLLEKLDVPPDAFKLGPGQWTLLALHPESGDEQIVRIFSSLSFRGEVKASSLRAFLGGGMKKK
jgi:hypothetical protein